MRGFFGYIQRSWKLCLSFILKKRQFNKYDVCTILLFNYQKINPYAWKKISQKILPMQIKSKSHPKTKKHIKAKQKWFLKSLSNKNITVGYQALSIIYYTVIAWCWATQKIVLNPTVSYFYYYTNPLSLLGRFYQIKQIKNWGIKIIRNILVNLWLRGANVCKNSYKIFAKILQFCKNVDYVRLLKTIPMYNVAMKLANLCGF